MKVLICGAGISGLTLAWCLARDGHGVSVVERSNHLRDDGYMIDLFGSGYDASEDIGLLTRLQSLHDAVDHLTFIDAEGHERVSLPYRALRNASVSRAISTSCVATLCESFATASMVVATCAWVPRSRVWNVVSAALSCG
jgi:2-polyprenyl-6-methoxyphenol hydroxylase-like FAD-dependent oxidoreductase